MNTTILNIKDEVHELIDTINDENILNAVKTLIQPYSYNSEVPEEHWLKIEKDDDDYKNGIGKNYTWNEVETILSTKKK